MKMTVSLKNVLKTTKRDFVKRVKTKNKVLKRSSKKRSSRQLSLIRKSLRIATKTFLMMLSSRLSKSLNSHKKVLTSISNTFLTIKISPLTISLTNSITPMLWKDTITSDLLNQSVLPVLKSSEEEEKKIILFYNLYTNNIAILILWKIILKYK